MRYHGMPCHIPCNYIAVQYFALFNLHLHFLRVALRYIVLPLEHTHVTVTCVYQSGDALTTCVSDALTTCVSVCVYHLNRCKTSWINAILV